MYVGPVCTSGNVRPRCGWRAFQCSCFVQSLDDYAIHHLLTFSSLLPVVLLLSSVLLLVWCSVPIAVGWSVRAQGSVRTVGMPRSVVDSVFVVFAILVPW